MALDHAVASPQSGLLDRLDRLGVLVALLVLAGVATPFVAFRANRIVPGEPVGLLAALPVWAVAGLGAVLLIATLAGLVRLAPRLKLLTAGLALVSLVLALGEAGRMLTPEGDRIARIAPGTGFWLLLLGFALMATDAVARQRLRPWSRIGLLLVVAGMASVLLWSGALAEISVLREYANRAEEFWREAQVHVGLALGSLVAASVVGVPLGIFCDRVPPVRAAILGTLNAVQTIPSITLFGLLIAPLAWVGANVPGAAALGIAGIGMAPALLALFLYALLPIVGNTVSGLAGVPESAEEAARGMGMTDTERLVQVDLPLAFPVILTGIRIVLVQNIGLATVAALIGGGGFGVFIFQGVGQTAMDLVLLGAVPTVAMAFFAAVVLDAGVEMVSREQRR